MLVLYGLTLFLSAALLFGVQPMVGKMLLPSFGGTPAVWNTCMVFFQGVLLAGYAYAHGSMALLRPRLQALLHVLLLALAAAFLPIDVTADAPPRAAPAGWLLWMLVSAIGVPLVMVSSSAPLLQKWLASSAHRFAGDPYFLYAASNAGSLLALLAYPLLIEPNLVLGGQSRAWSAGYALLVLLTAGCSLLLRHNPARSPQLSANEYVRVGGGRGDDRASEPAPGVALRLRWVLWALVPSSLLLGVTTHITTNIAAVPLLWVIPLALYLLTFILAFARGTAMIHRAVVAVHPYVVVIFGPLIFFQTPALRWMAVLPHLLLLFVIALACHGHLAAARPGTGRLTEYYFWIAVGGVAGGAFNTFVAPVLFDSILEYPLMVVLSCFLQTPARQSPVAVAGSGVPGQHSPFQPSGRSAASRWSDVLWPALLGALCIGGAAMFAPRSLPNSRQVAAATIAVLAVACAFFRHRPMRFGLGLTVLLAMVAYYGRVPAERLLRVERNFFGTKTVMIDEHRRFCRFIHGTTNHGMQWLDPLRRQEPTAYYHRAGPIGDVFATPAARHAREVAIVGLGAGGLAPYAGPEQHFTFYEIDPAVERIARDPRCFTYLQDCRGETSVVLGDGRLSLQHAPDGHYGLIVLDAFSSDAVPTHLLSIEALELYLRKLRPDGLVVFNVTNAYLDFSGVMANLADRAGLVGVHREDRVNDDAEQADGRMPCHYVVMARDAAGLGGLDRAPGWSRLVAQPGQAVWSDQYCDLLAVLRPPGLR